MVEYYVVEPKAKLRPESYTVVGFSDGKLEVMIGDKNINHTADFRITPSGRIKTGKNFNFYKVSEKEAEKLKKEKEEVDYSILALKWN
jgi:hypothetical protein